MLWALAAVVIAVVFLMATNSARKLPWLHKMRRLRAGSEMADWMAPDGVVEQVKTDYLHVIEWMQNSPAYSWPQQWRGAPEVLAGAFLRRYQQILIRQRGQTHVSCYGVLRADHDLDVRGFSSDGSRCWLIDQQSGRRIATYESEHHERIMTQDMGDGAIVVQMHYDAQDARWKLEALVQELPTGYQRRNKLHLSAELPNMPKRIGRDA